MYRTAPLNTDDDLILAGVEISVVTGMKNGVSDGDKVAYSGSASFVGDADEWGDALILIVTD